MNDASLTPVQRSAAIDRADETLVLRSGAGSGKTFVLARRFVECLLRARQPGKALSRLVALTFTEKAALEMSQRVRSMLEALATSGRVEPARVAGWLEQLPEARISTIHGFCASLLRTWSVEAGVDPGFSVCADELLASRIRRHEAEQTLLSGAAEGDDDVEGILLTVSAGRAIELLSDLARDHSPEALEASSDAGATLRRWRETWSVARREAWERMAVDDDLRKAMDLVADGVCNNPDDRLERLRWDRLDLAERVLDDPSVRTPGVFAELVGPAGNIGSGKAWRDPTPKEMRARVKTMGQRFAAYAPYAEQLGPADEASAQALARLARTARKVSEGFLRQLASRGMLGFDHLLGFAERLLRTDAGIRAAVGGGIDQLLVDESQDTDAVQWSLISLAAGGGIEGNRPRGRLFAVGDAKQSIYRFRGAKVEVFGEFCDRLGEGRQERLDVSFRTHAAGVAFINELFGRLWAEDYEPTRAHRADLPPGPSVEVLLAGGVETPEPADEAASTEAQAGVVAERIVRMVADGERLVRDRETGAPRPARYGDLAVLFTRMTHSLAYERALQRRGVPYYVVGGTGFFHRQEVYDVLNALRVVDNPLDDIALAGVLRSSLVGLDDNALARVAQAVGSPWLDALRRSCDDDGTPVGLDEDQRAALGEAVALFEQLSAVKDAMGIDGLIRRLVDATGYEAVLLSAPQGARMVGNVRRLEEMAREATASGLRLSEFIETVGEQVLHQERCEQAAVVGEEEDVVRLMTVHRAKGLEFPVVLVPDLNAARRPLRADVIEHGRWGLTCRLTDRRSMDDDESGPERTDQTPLSFRMARAGEKAAADAEDLRLLYVAMTRHEDHLVLVAGNQRTGDERRLAQKSSAIALLDDALHLRDALDRGEGRLPYAGGRFEARVGEVDPPCGDDLPAQLALGERLVDRAQTGAAFAASLPGSADGALPLLGPPSCESARAELAVTALSDFEHCPMLYRWRYELRVPDRPAGLDARATPGSGERAGASDGAPRAHRPDAPCATLDALTLGTFFHRCMELADVQALPDAAVLAGRVAEEMEIDDVAKVDRLAGELAGILDRFARHELRDALRSARRSYRELDFLLSIGPLRLRGQIDLLFEDAFGTWRIVDYKSDRLERESPAERLERYRLQLSAYALAVGRHRDEAPGSATLYFLRDARTAEMPLGDDALAGAAEGLERLGRELVAARRAGRFEKRRGAQCGFCPYAQLCGAGDGLSWGPGRPVSRA